MKFDTLRFSTARRQRERYLMVERTSPPAQGSPEFELRKAFLREAKSKLCTIVVSPRCSWHEIEFTEVVTTSADAAEGLILRAMVFAPTAPPATAGSGSADPNVSADADPGVALLGSTASDAENRDTSSGKQTLCSLLVCLASGNLLLPLPRLSSVMNAVGTALSSSSPQPTSFTSVSTRLPRRMAVRERGHSQQQEVSLQFLP